MAKKKNVGDDLAGTVEGAARDHWEREKAAYEERTGEKVKYEPSEPTTRTPLTDRRATADVGGTGSVDADESKDSNSDENSGDAGESSEQNEDPTPEGEGA